jgi:bifunctional pyridoxal-dependent enzyme with beta-cystathionase and maltose regulon repressor activities
MKVDEEIYAELMKKKLFLGKGKAFGGEKGGWFRIVFTHPQSYLDEGFHRLWQVLNAS